MAECQSPEDCNDFNDCTDDTCTDRMCEYTPLADGTACDESNECKVGMCASGACDPEPVADGTACGGGAGTCLQGSCVGTFACTDQGIRDAVAVGGGPHGFDCDGPQTVVLEEAVFVDQNVILDGLGNLSLTSERPSGFAEPLFVVQDGSSFELRKLKLSNPLSECLVGGGELKVVDSAFEECGTGIQSGNGALHVENSTFTDAGIRVFGSGWIVDTMIYRGGL